MTVATTATTTAVASKPRRARKDKGAEKNSAVDYAMSLPRFTSPQAQLSECLIRMSAVAPTNPHQPILSNVMLATGRLEDGSGYVSFAATSLGVTVYETLYNVEVVGDDAAVTIPAKPLSELVKLLTGSVTFAIDMEKAQIVINPGERQKTLKGIPGDEFPTIPSLDDDGLRSVKASAIREAIKAVVGASDDDLGEDNRFSDIRLWLRGQSLVVDAADGRRIARHVVVCEDGPELDVQILIPGLFVRSFVSMLQGEIIIQANDRLVAFCADTFTVVAVQSAKTFIGVEQLVASLPAPDQMVAVAKIEDLLAEIKIAKMFAPNGTQSNMVKLTFTDAEEMPVMKTFALGPLGEHHGGVTLVSCQGSTEVLVDIKIIEATIKDLGCSTVIFERSSKYPGLRIRREDRPGSVQIIAPLQLV